MQQFPPNQKAERRTRGCEPRYEIEQHREDDEPEATRDWLAHIDAGRIAIW